MTPPARIAARVVLVAVTVAGAVGMGCAGSSVAGPAGTTLRYQCSMPLFPVQPMTVRLTWNAPKSVPVGQKTPIVPFTAVATMGAAVTQGLDVINAATVEGSADASGDVAAPDGNTNVRVPLTVPKTDVPPDGPITVVASGITPELTFHRPGHATITVGSEFAVHLIPKTADGGTTLLGPVDASCTLNPGQDTRLTSFDIAAPPGQPAPPPAAPTTATGSGPIAPGPRQTGTTGPRGSVATQTPSTAPSSGVSPTEDTTTAATHDTAFTAPAARLAAAAAPWLVGGALLVIGAVLGCVWWLRRRHRRGGPGHPDSL